MGTQANAGAAYGAGGADATLSGSGFRDARSTIPSAMVDLLRAESAHVAAAGRAT
jgi:hypothetical protein